MVGYGPQTENNKTQKQRKIFQEERLGLLKSVLMKSQSGLGLRLDPRAPGSTAGSSDPCKHLGNADGDARLDRASSMWDRSSGSKLSREICKGAAESGVLTAALRAGPGGCSSELQLLHPALCTSAGATSSASPGHWDSEYQLQNNLHHFLLS